MGTITTHGLDLGAREHELAFGAGDPARHVQVPLLVTSWGCSIYRGS